MISLFVYLVLSYVYTLTLPSRVVMSGSTVGVTQEPFGSVPPSGSAPAQSVIQLTLTNQRGAQLRLITFGAAITGLVVPDRDGQLEDVVLGFDDMDGYLGVKTRNPYFGAIVGRVANRIGQAQFTLNGVRYQLAANNGENSLHGGVLSFAKVVWQPHVHRDGRVTMTLSSSHMDEGYPGHLVAQVTYTLTQDNEVVIDFKAVTDRPTPVNLASHGYFNLAGHGAGSQQLYDHRVQLNADRYTPVDAGLIPTGEIANVDGTLFDLRMEVRLGDVVQQMPGGGYDHNFVVSAGEGRSKFNGTLPLVASVHHPKSGRLMHVFSDQPGFQFYTGNFLPLDGSLVGKRGTVYSKHGGLCVETQNFPNAINQANFPDAVLQPGTVYQRTAVYKFGVQ